jgi:predicted branched-subunit amino acid permease
VPQAISWISGTVIGVVAAGSIHDPNALGLDAVFPAFYLALLLREASGRRAYEAMALAAVITIGLTTFAPPGVPVILASSAALLGLRQRR